MTSQAAALPSSPLAHSLLYRALLLGVAFTALRALAMLGPVAWRPLFLIHCIFMAATPWLLLSRAGRQECGIQRGGSLATYAGALAFGAAAASACHVLGYALFGTTADNWFVSVANSFRAQPTPGLGIVQIYLMFTIPAILFSPFGEEIFFRGVLQRALETRFSARTATLLEAIWFGAAHLIHHGLLLSALGLTFLWQSGPLWFLLMTALSLGLAALRKSAGSVWPAVAAHAAFNATMNTFIFSSIWNA
ncbi:CPBP family intramembrane glutamic endopeptidase [Massilia sp. SR12]